MEHARDKKTQGEEVMQMENNKREVTSTLRNVHWSTPIILKYETRFVKDQGYSKSSNP